MRPLVRSCDPGRPRPQAWVLDQPGPSGPSPALSSAEMAGSPRFLEGLPRSGSSCQAIAAQECCRPWTLRRRPRRQCAFRGSLTQPSASLSTLRRRPFAISPRKTRFRLVASRYPAGFSPAGSHLKGFRSVDDGLYRFPLSQAYPGAHRLARPSVDRLSTSQGDDAAR